MKGVGHGGMDDKEVAINPENMPKSCCGCEFEFGESDPTIFLDDKLWKRVHNNTKCIAKARERLG